MFEGDEEDQDITSSRRYTYVRADPELHTEKKIQEKEQFEIRLRIDSASHTLLLNPRTYIPIPILPQPSRYPRENNVYINEGREKQAASSTFLSSLGQINHIPIIHIAFHLLLNLTM
ncbi:unnamed protein product [Allacma fusca]|uniref:Uncharacterized protein n=1 Tax=Allacma fusca TaxID=39272 RepID=A0A8J2P2D6_9HEXA|nr:unnamed protein product [Allacma fusca]